MGVLVEGISFYGLEELYIFMVDDLINIIQALLFGILTVSSITFWFIYFIFFYK